MWCVSLPICKCTYFVQIEDVSYRNICYVRAGGGIQQWPFDFSFATARVRPLYTQQQRQTTCTSVLKRFCCVAWSGPYTFWDIRRAFECTIFNGKKINKNNPSCSMSPQESTGVIHSLLESIGGAVALIFLIKPGICCN